jgi:histidyl-tRNA synthetase
MKVKPQNPKGTRDFLPEEVAKRNFLIDTIKGVFRKYGFVQIDTPAVERIETLTGKYGEEGDRLLFKILNSGEYLKNVEQAALIDNDYKVITRNIAEKGLRYDLTVPLARYVVQHQDKIAFPFKRFHIGPVWRADRPQKGRYQEFYQCDADVIGSESLLNEAELLFIFDEVLSILKVPQCELRISNRKLLAALADVLNAGDKFSELTIAIDKLDKVEKSQVFADLKDNGFSEAQIAKLDEYLSISGSNEEKLQALGSFFANNEIGKNGIEEVSFVLKKVKVVEATAEVVLDLSLARGLNYYTGFITEVKTAAGSLRSSIGSGGRYDNLTEMFGGKNMMGVGISFGIERIYDIMEELDLFPADVAQGTTVLFTYFDEPTRDFAFELAQKVRAAGIATEVYPSLSKLQKQLTYANNKKIPYAVIIGEEELKSGLLTIKNLEAGSQEKLNLEGVIEKLSITR